MSVPPIVDTSPGTARPELTVVIPTSDRLPRIAATGSVSALSQEDVEPGRHLAGPQHGHGDGTGRVDPERPSHPSLSVPIDLRAPRRVDATT